jgi:hypothetical protein
MNNSDSEGLGLSMLIYAGAIVVALTTITVPVYYANTAQVYDNPPPPPADPLLNGPIIGDREPARHPLAILKHRVIVDPKVVAALNAKVKKATPEPHVAEHVERRPVNVSRSEPRPEPRHSTFFLFRLFGG